MRRTLKSKGNHQKNDLLWEKLPSSCVIRHDETCWSSVTPFPVIHPFSCCLETPSSSLYCRSHDDSSYARKLLQNQGSNKQINDIEKKSTTSQFEFFSSLFLGCFPLACLLPTKHLLPERISRRPNLRYQPWRNSKTNCFMKSPI